MIDGFSATIDGILQINLHLLSNQQYTQVHMIVLTNYLNTFLWYNNFQADGII
jgi:hypothetical protein